MRSKTIAIRLGIPLYEALVAKAAKEGVPVAVVVRQMLERQMLNQDTLV